jgi:hypothetical protein
MQRYTVYFSGNCSTCFGWFERAVGGIRHPQHAQTSSNSFTIAADSNNGVTNTICCRYSCLRSCWWVMVPPETCGAFSRKIHCVTLHLLGCILLVQYYYDARTHEHQRHCLVSMLKTSKIRCPHADCLTDTDNSFCCYLFWFVNQDLRTI